MILIGLIAGLVIGGIFGFLEGIVYAKRSGS